MIGRAKSQLLPPVGTVSGVPQPVEAGTSHGQGWHFLAWRTAAIAVGVLAPVLALANLLLLIGLARKGFDLTDEAYYLLASSSPDSVRSSTSLFYLWNSLLMEAAGGCVWAYRSLGIVLLSAAGGFVGWGSLWFLRSTGVPARPLLTVALISAWVSLGVSFYSVTFFSPGYNWLNLVGMLVGTGGALLALAQSPDGGEHRRLVALMVSGGGIALSVASKAPAGLVLGILLALVIGIEGARRWGGALTGLMWLLGGVLAVAALQALAIQGPADTLAVLVHGYSAIQELGLHRPHSLLSSHAQSYLDGFSASLTSYGYWLVASSLLGLALGLWPASRWSRSMKVGMLVLMPLTALVWASATGGFEASERADRRLVPFALGTLVVLYGSTIGLIVGERVSGSPDARRVGFAFAAPLLLGFVSLGYPVGTGNPDPFLEGRYAMIGLLGGTALLQLYVLARYRRVEYGVAFLVVLQAVLGYRTLALQERIPYRLAAPLVAQTVPLTIGPARSRLLTDPLTASYVQEVRDRAAEAGFIPGTPVLDATGFRPGLAYVLGGRFLGVPWLLGGYPGSQAFAARALSLGESDEGRAAWVGAGGLARVQMDAAARLAP